MSSHLRPNRFRTHVLPAIVLSAAASLIGYCGTDSAQAATVSTWDKVADCESSGNWKTNTGNGYFGGLQFTQNSWEEFGGSQYAARADLATKQQQITIAEKVLATQGPTAWPVCSAKAGLTQDDPAPELGSQQANKIVDVALKQAGLPYVWGGGSIDGPTQGGFDCSGLTAYAVYQATDGEVTLPRTTQEQHHSGQGVTREEMQPGDLIVFDNDGNWGHVGIYIGDGKMIHAPRPGKMVEITELDDYWQQFPWDVRRLT